MDQSIIQVLLVFLAFITFLRYRSSASGSNLDHIPTVGYSSPILSYISAIKFIWAGKEIIEEGYRKHPNQVWKFPTLRGWSVIANGTRKLTEMGRAPEEQLSLVIHFGTLFQLDYTLGPEVTTDPYHSNVARGALTRNIANQFDGLREEMMLAFENIIPCAGGSAEWVSVPVYPGVVEVISRIIARLFVGRPLCNNKEFHRICLQASGRIVNGRVLRYFPKFLRPTVQRLFLDVHSDLKSMEKLLQPLLDYRLEQEQMHGSSWPEKPNDVLTWMSEEAVRAGREVTSQDIAVRLYFICFASFLMSTMLMRALCELAKRPEYLNPLREEVENLIAQERWSEDTISKMHKLDSFLREVLRYYDVDLLHVGRAVLQDFTFSDGTFIPAGSTIHANSWGIHHSNELYPSPHEFQGFRFLNEEDSLKQPSMSKATIDYNPFGYGKHACPGRFFVATQLKTMLAHVITTYDIKNETEGANLDDVWIEASRFPNTNIKVLFKKRDCVS